MLSILIADDEAFLLHILAEKIGRAGHAVTTASDGQQALEFAGKTLPDLIITDFQMPVMSGLEMSAKLREDPRTAKIPVLLVTARGHRVEAAEMARTNIVAIIAKPFSAKELLAKIEQIAAGIQKAQGAKASAA